MELPLRLWSRKNSCRMPSKERGIWVMRVLLQAFWTGKREICPWPERWNLFCVAEYDSALREP